MISGRCTIVSSRLLPQKRLRASSQAMATPNGRLVAVAVTATSRLSRTAVHSSGVMSQMSCRRVGLHQHREALLLEGGPGLGALEVIEEGLGVGRLRGLDHGCGIDDRRMRIGGEGADDLDVGLGRGVGR